MYGELDVSGTKLPEVLRKIANPDKKTIINQINTIMNDKIYVGTSYKTENEKVHFTNLL